MDIRFNCLKIFTDLISQFFREDLSMNAVVKLVNQKVIPDINNLLTD